MSAVNRLLAESISHRRFESSAVGLVVPGFEELPATLLSTLGKALTQAIAADGFLVLRADSIRIELSGGVCVTGSDCLSLLQHSRSNSLQLVELTKVPPISGPGTERMAR